MELPEAVTQRILERWPVARLAALGSTGGPWQIPIVFARRDSVLYSPIDAKPKRPGALARVSHIQRDPRVSLLLDEYGDDWSQLWWLRCEGRAAVRGASDLEGQAAASALRAKYPQYAHTELFRGDPRLIRIELGRLAGWCATPAGLAELEARLR